MRIGIDFRMGGSINAGIGRYIFELLKAILEIENSVVILGSSGNESPGIHAAVDAVSVDHPTGDDKRPQNQYFVFYNIKNVAAEDLAVLKDYDNVTLVATNIRHYSIAEQIVFPKILNKYNLDLVHFPNFNVPIFYKRPFVVTIHDVVHHKISGHKKTHILHFWAYKKVIEKAAEHARKIITVSEVAKKDIVDYLQVPPEKVEVIYEGSSLLPQEQSHVDRVRQQFLLGRPYFLFVGTLERKKNIVALARAFDLFLEKYKLSMDLVFAGKVDSHYPDIKYQALEIHHKDHLVFTDFVSEHDLACLYQGAHAFVSASLHEGFGLPGVEAMKFGLPLLVSNIEVFNEIYDNAALYFNPEKPEDIAEKMYLIAKDEQFHAQMQEKSWNRGQQFSWQKAAEQTLKVYEERI